MKKREVKGASTPFPPLEETLQSHSIVFPTHVSLFVGGLAGVSRPQHLLCEDARHLPCPAEGSGGSAHQNANQGKSGLGTPLQTCPYMNGRAGSAALH